MIVKREFKITVKQLDQAMDAKVDIITPVVCQMMMELSDEAIKQGMEPADLKIIVAFEEPL